MDCCQCEIIDDHFDRKKAEAKLDTYHKKGGQQTSEILVSALVEIGIEGLTLLDVGGGIGVIQHELLGKGVIHATNLEGSAAYINACISEAERQGHAYRITSLHGDFADMAEAPDADIVTLERVICCYPDMPRLVSMACRKSKRFLGLVYPRNAWWVKAGIQVFYNLRFVLQRSSFRVYMHPTQEVDALVKSFGFERLFYQTSGPWQVVIYGH